MVDKAERKLRAALDGDHGERSLRAAFFILSHSAAARERGWGRARGSTGFDDIDPPPAPIRVIWTGDLPGYQPTGAAIPEARAAEQASDSAG
jgi:hypothetical protein